MGAPRVFKIAEARKLPGSGEARVRRVERKDFSTSIFPWQYSESCPVMHPRIKGELRIQGAKFLFNLANHVLWEFAEQPILIFIQGSAITHPDFHLPRTTSQSPDQALVKMVNITDKIKEYTTIQTTSPENKKKKLTKPPFSESKMKCAVRKVCTPHRLSLSRVIKPFFYTF